MQCISGETGDVWLSVCCIISPLYTKWLTAVSKQISQPRVGPVMSSCKCCYDQKLSAFESQCIHDIL